jgi:hypothetical protein
VSGAYGILGLVFLVVGAMAMVQGAWMAITARSPRWASSRHLPGGRERGLGLVLIVTGLGCVLLGASDIEAVAFSGLRLVGIGPFLLGAVLVIVFYRPRPSP